MLKVLILTLSYLYGSLPITEYLARRKGVDLRKVGSGKVGSGNLWQTTGAINGMMGGLSDLSKGGLPHFVARALGFSSSVSGAAAVAGVAGQMWPIFRKFDGGRGNSPALGLALALSPRAFLLSIIPMLAGGAVWSYPIVSQRHLPWKMRMKFRSPFSDVIPLGMFIGWLGLPLFAGVLKEPRSVTKACAAASFLLMLRRVSGELGEDLRSGANLGRTIPNRLLYDRKAR
ncbi:MAG: glycerol-3-phosphate acyltransferase [Dehalococcoidia bacterium]